ncbi:sensor histidine kinase [Sphaerisporangium fuscum]|uniref:sensor histidine kinase n=1 Tax=Sphaerisporangium fuscum TaxID=2835868 RepID=UPI001BDBEB8A|nr:nitrate- and nitrite sensing domain-containing protein [Sphaerisporangium fuscum]
MSSRKRSIRFKIFSLLLLPLLSLSALWGFVLNLTVGDGVSLLRSNTIYQSVGVTSTDLGLQVQAERSLSAAVLSVRSADQSRLATQRHTTDVSLAKFEAAATSDGLQGALTPAMKTALTALLNDLEHLQSIRASVDTRQAGRLATIQAYNRIMDSLFRLYDRITSVPDLSIYGQAGAMQGMGHARETIARENALVNGAISSGSLSDDEYAALAEWIADRRFLYAKSMSTLDDELRRPYEEVFASANYKRFTEMEQALIREARLAGPLPDSVDRWRPVTDSLSAALDQVNSKASDKLAERTKGVAMGILLRIALAGGLGLVAVAASIIISVRFGRRLVRELADLRNSARELADVRLPRVVERLRRGDEVDVDTEAPQIPEGNSSETADVAHAFGSVQRTAVEAAVGQANLRKGVSQVFLNLARRKQGLLHRQLTLLDAMQRRATEPEALDDLFHLDHLTTRMRRHAESLIILSGAAPGRAWRKPVPVLDVVRAAVAEVEDYTRVRVLPLPNAHLSGTVVADLIHLIAELIENATIFSPPQTTVQVRGDMVANGFAVEIEDRGLGLTPEEYDEINARLADPPEFDLADSDRLGLFVVGQLAARHDVSVVLRSSPYGGTTAIVLMPKELVVDPGSAPPVPGSLADGGPQHARDPLAGPRPQQSLGTTAEPEAEPPFFAPPAQRSSDGPALTIVPNLADTGPFHVPSPDTAPEPQAAPAPDETEDRPSPTPPQRGSVSSGTHRGLPRRVRQANMAPQLRESTGPYAAPTPPSGAPVASGPAERSPDEARAMFSAFQQGGRRGRLEAGLEGPDAAEKGEDQLKGPASRGDVENPLPGRHSATGERATTQSGERDQKRDLRDHSGGYVHQTTGEKGDE